MPSKTEGSARRGHPDTLLTMSNLASTYDRQGLRREAQVLFMQCFEKRKIVLGENHPDTLDTMNKLRMI